jgi:proline-specific peptidase
MVNHNDNFLILPQGKVWYRISGNGPGTPLLALHGGPGYPSDYLWNLEQLSDERPVIFYDQLGCGRSDRPSNTSLWTVEYFVKELQQIREALRLDQIHLLGHSWGAMLATDYLLTKPEGVKSVIFAGPCISIALWRKATSRYLDELPNNFGNVIRQAEKSGNTQDPLYKEAEHLYHITHECRVDPPPANAQASSAGFGKAVYNYMWGPNEYTISGTLKNYDRSNRLKELKIPALFTCGKYDGASPEATAFYRSQMPGAGLKIFETSSHMPHLEQEAAYVQTVREFLQGHT